MAVDDLECREPPAPPADPEAPPYAALRAQLIEEQADLWHDLHDAVRNSRVEPPAVPGHWSMACDDLARRILENAALVGPVPWEQIQVDLLLGGIYARVLHVAGITPPPVDWDAVRDCYAANHAGADDAIWIGPPVDLTAVNPDWVSR